MCYVYKLVQLAGETKTKTCQISEENGTKTLKKIVKIYFNLFFQGPKPNQTIFAGTIYIFKKIIIIFASPWDLIELSGE